MYTQELEKFSTVTRWLNKVAGQGIESNATRKLYLHFLSRYITFMKKTPDQLIAEHRENMKSDDEFKQRLHEEKLQAFEAYLEKKKGLARSSIGTAHNIIKSFYGANYADLKVRPIKTWAATKRSVPTPDQLLAMIESTEQYRDKAVMICLAQSGLGMEDFLSIPYGDIKDELDKDVEPLWIQIVREKTKTTHDTFLGKDALTYLRLYLAETNPKKTELIFDLTSRTVENIVKGASIKAHIAPHVTPHKLRSFFKTYLTLAKVPEEIVEYWMGHKTAYGGAYLVPPVDIETKQSNVKRISSELEAEATEDSDRLKEIPSQRKLYRDSEWVISVLKE